jgi:hypothetical protein
MRDSNVANAAKESAHAKFSHGLQGYGLSVEGVALSRLAAG